MSNQAISGRHLIDGEWVTSAGPEFRAMNPATGAALEPSFPTAGEPEVEQAFHAALHAADQTRDLPASRWADLLEAIATELEARGDALVERAAQETALPAKPRLAGELGRTTGQLRLFAELIREGSWVDAVIDTAQPDRKPLPRSDIRRALRPIGPVAVFGASNFPFAFGAMGGDTASALAAGNPVVVKGHPSHPGVSELVASAVLAALQSTGLPLGLFALLQGAGNEIGESVVLHPAAAAVGFTGSLRGGRALFDLAARRPRPIPVYAEMGSLNPLVVLHGALAERSEAIAKGLAGSITLGAGQFCTKPGLVLVIDGPDADTFIEQVTQALAAAPEFTLLGAHLRDAFGKATGAIAGVGAVSTPVSGACSGYAQASASLFQVDSTTWRRERALHQEAFGPAALIVRCADVADLLATVRATEGNLTGSVHFGPLDAVETVHDVLGALSDVAGRVLCNGFPTGVEVGHAMVHGGPYPSTTDSRSTSVGTAAITRYARPIAYQDVPDAMLPPALQNANESGILRRVNGAFTREAL